MKNNDRLRIWEWMCSHKGQKFTCKQVADELEVNVQVVRRFVKQLMEMKYVIKNDNKMKYKPEYEFYSVETWKENKNG